MRFIMPYIFLWTYILHHTISIIKVESSNPSLLIEDSYQRLWAKIKHFFLFTLLWNPRKCMYCVLCKARYIILCLSTGSCSKKWWRDPRKRNNSGKANVAKNYCLTWIKSIIVIDTPFSRLAKTFFWWSALWSLVFFSYSFWHKKWRKKNQSNIWLSFNKK